MSTYYDVKEPFRVYRAVGLSKSNTWVGRSQAITTVFEAVNTLPGDEIHVLPGGTFLVSDGAVWSMVFTPPKHIFEKTYGIPDTPDQILQRGGRCAQIEKTDATTVSYAEARARVDSKWFHDGHAQVIEVDMSPELADFDDAMISAITVLDEVKLSTIRDSLGQSLKWRYFDQAEKPTVGLSVHFDNYYELGKGNVRQDAALRAEWAFRANDQEQAATITVPVGTEMPGFLPSSTRDKWTYYKMPKEQVSEAVKAFLFAKFAPNPGPRR